VRNDSFIANFLTNVTVTIIYKSVNIWQKYEQNFGAYSLAQPALSLSRVHKRRLQRQSAVVSIRL